MNYKVTDQDIESVCLALLREQSAISVRGVMRALKARLGAKGRTERVAEILNRTRSQFTSVPSPVQAHSGEVDELLLKLRAAEARASLAEEREEAHQHYWARRYAEKVAELEAKYAAFIPNASRSASEQYLRLYQRAAELVTRLSKYEEVEFMDGSGSGGALKRAPDGEA